MITNYVPITSVLYDLSLTIDERYYNEAKMTEWLVHGLRQINLEPVFETKTALLTVESHKTTLPSDFKFLVQAAQYVWSPSSTDLEDETLPELSTWELINSSTIGWKPMRLASNPYHASICLEQTITKCYSCIGEFSISPSLVVTTNFETGTIMVAYLAYAKDSDNNILIPDDETLKEALLHYVLYRYWLAKDVMKEEGAERRMIHHLQRWNLLRLKAMNLNLPDTNQYENIKSNFNRLVPRENKFQQFFMTLNNRENVDF